MTLTRRLKLLNSGIIGLALTTLVTSAGATGLMSCVPVDKSQWMSEEKVTEKLVKEGWEVRFMKPDGGCWEVYGTNPDGKRVEAYLHPVTGEKLLVSQRGTILFRKESTN